LVKIVLANIIENAILFSSPREPNIIIHWTYSEKEVIITLEDNGTGILDNVKPKIFEMFFRGSELSQGNGLGLYVTKRAVDKLGGKITFKSTLNKGSLFTVIIPNQPI
jgi:signal transduction histidine kinase